MIYADAVLTELKEVRILLYRHAALTGLKGLEETCFYKHIVPTGLKKGNNWRSGAVRKPHLRGFGGSFTTHGV